MTECVECPGLFSLFLPLLDDFSLSGQYSHLYTFTFLPRVGSMFQYIKGLG